MNRLILIVAFATSFALTKPLIPPDTDFSRFAQKYAWLQSPEYLEELSTR